MSEEVKIIRFRHARRSLGIPVLRHLPPFGPVAHSAGIVTDEIGNFWQIGRTKGRDQLEHRPVDILVLKDRQNLDGYWYQDVMINGEHWNIEYQGTIPSTDTTVRELKEIAIEHIKKYTYQVLDTNCDFATQAFQKHLNPEKLPKPISLREPGAPFNPWDVEELARSRRLSSPKPEGGIQNDVPQQPNANMEDLLGQEDGSRNHFLPRAYDDWFIDMPSCSSSPYIRGACAQGTFYKRSSFEALNLEHPMDSVLNRQASSKLKIQGPPSSISPLPSDYFAKLEDTLMDILREPSYVPSLQIPPIEIVKMDLPNGALPEVQLPFNKEFSRLHQQPKIELKRDPLIKVSDEHQKFIRDGIVQATHANGADGCIKGIAIGSVGAVVSSVTGGALTVAPTAAGGLALSLNLLNPWVWVGLGVIGTGYAIGAAIDYASGSSTAETHED